MDWEGLWATYSTLVFSVGINILLALSVYLTLATGLLTVANAAFMGIGAYTAAWLTTHSAAPFWFALILGTISPAAMALAIGRPTLRLSGVYLAMATLATLIVLPSVYSLAQQSAHAMSPSLDPDDPDSRHRAERG